MGLRVTAEAKGRIERAAIKSGRSISAESEFRIERSFSDDAMFDSETLRLWAYLVAREFSITGRLEAKSREIDEADEIWTRNPDCLLRAAMAVTRVLSRDYLAAGGAPETMCASLERLALNFEPKTAFGGGTGNEK